MVGGGVTNKNLVKRPKLRYKNENRYKNETRYTEKYDNSTYLELFETREMLDRIRDEDKNDVFGLSGVGEAIANAVNREVLKPDDNRQDNNKDKNRDNNQDNTQKNTQISPPSSPRPLSPYRPQPILSCEKYAIDVELPPVQLFPKNPVKVDKKPVSEFYDKTVLNSDLRKNTAHRKTFDQNMKYLEYDAKNSDSNVHRNINSIVDDVKMLSTKDLLEMNQKNKNPDCLKKVGIKKFRIPGQNRVIKREVLRKVEIIQKPKNPVKIVPKTSKFREKQYQGVLKLEDPRQKLSKSTQDRKRNKKLEASLKKLVTEKFKTVDIQDFDTVQPGTVNIIGENKKLAHDKNDTETQVRGTIQRFIEREILEDLVNKKLAEQPDSDYTGLIQRQLNQMISEEFVKNSVPKPKFEEDNFIFTPQPTPPFSNTPKQRSLNNSIQDFRCSIEFQTPTIKYKRPIVPDLAQSFQPEKKIPEPNTTVVFDPVVESIVTGEIKSEGVSSAPCTTQIPVSMPLSVTATNSEHSTVTSENSGRITQTISYGQLVIEPGELKKYDKIKLIGIPDLNKNPGFVGELEPGEASQIPDKVNLLGFSAETGHFNDETFRQDEDHLLKKGSGRFQKWRDSVTIE